MMKKKKKRKREPDWVREKRRDEQIKAWTEKMKSETVPFKIWEYQKKNVIR